MTVFFFFQAEDGIRDLTVTGVQTCALPISDVTGFGLLGHLRTLLEASGAAAEVRAAAVPLLPHAREAAERGAIPGGTERNAASVADAVSFAPGVDQMTRLLLADAQTPGRLLVADTL